MSKAIEDARTVAVRLAEFLDDIGLGGVVRVVGEAALVVLLLAACAGVMR